MREVYNKPVSLEMNREERAHYRIISVVPDPGDGNLFIARYEILDDEDGDFFPFELRVPKDVKPAGEYWKPLFEQVGELYGRREDVLTYGYKIMQLIIEAVFKQTKKAPPKKKAAKKPQEEQSGEEDE